MSMHLPIGAQKENSVWALELVIVVHNWPIKLRYLLTVDMHFVVFVWAVRYKRLDVTCSCCKLSLIFQIISYLRMEAILKSALLFSALFFAFCATDVQCRTGWWVRVFIFVFILHLTSLVFSNSATIIINWFDYLYMIVYLVFSPNEIQIVRWESEDKNVCIWK